MTSVDPFSVALALLEEGKLEECARVSSSGRSPMWEQIQAILHVLIHAKRDNFYEVLGLDPGDALREARRRFGHGSPPPWLPRSPPPQPRPPALRYKSLARVLHPDVCSLPRATEAMSCLNRCMDRAVEALSSLEEPPS